MVSSRSKKYCLGIDMSASEIRCVELSFSKKTRLFSIEHFFVCSDDASLKSYLSNTVFQDKRWNMAVSVPESQVFTQRISLNAQLSKKEKIAYILSEIEKIALCPVKDLMVDCQVNTSEVLCAAVQRKTVESFIATFDEMGLKLGAICLGSQAYHLAVEQVNKQAIFISDASLTTACGLAMMQFIPSSDALNFLPRRKCSKRRLLGGFFLIGLVFISLYGYYFFNRPFKKLPLVQPVSFLYKIPFNELSTIEPLRMVGMIQLKKKGQVWALLKTPHNKIKLVTLGDSVGNAKAKVIQISSGCVTVRVQKNGAYQKYFIK